MWYFIHTNCQNQDFNNTMLVRIRKEKSQERPVHILKKTLEKLREKMSLYSPQSQPGQVQQSRTYRGPEGTH